MSRRASGIDYSDVSEREGRGRSLRLRKKQNRREEQKLIDFSSPSPCERTTMRWRVPSFAGKGLTIRFGKNARNQVELEDPA